MKTLSVSKVTRNGRSTRVCGRITLASEVLQAMNLDLGDFVQIVQDDGRVFLQKVTPAEN